VSDRVQDVFQKDGPRISLWRLTLG
jgi:hypothetical protein